MNASYCLATTGSTVEQRDDVRTLTEKEERFWNWISADLSKLRVHFLRFFFFFLVCSTTRATERFMTPLMGNLYSDHVPLLRRLPWLIWARGVHTLWNTGYNFIPSSKFLGFIPFHFTTYRKLLDVCFPLQRNKINVLKLHIIKITLFLVFINESPWSLTLTNHCR